MVLSATTVANCEQDIPNSNIEARIGGGVNKTYISCDTLLSAMVSLSSRAVEASCCGTSAYFQRSALKFRPNGNVEGKFGMMTSWGGKG